MPFVTKSFNQYVIYHETRQTSGSAHIAEIDCFLGSDRAGAMYFYPDGFALPADADTVNGVYLHFPISRFLEIVETLREEAPLTLWYDDVRQFGYLSTGWEPIGSRE